jgi:hypothetical protein
VNQECLKLRWGQAIDQKFSQCKGRLVRPPHNSNSNRPIIDTFII